MRVFSPTAVRTVVTSRFTILTLDIGVTCVVIHIQFCYITTMHALIVEDVRDLPAWEVYNKFFKHSIGGGGAIFFDAELVDSVTAFT